MEELEFPERNVKYPCYLIPHKCFVRNCYYFENTSIDKFGNCALRVAEVGPHKLEELATILGVTRERIRQIEATALRHLAWTSTSKGLTNEIRNIIKTTLGNVDFWPAATHSASKKIPEFISQLDLIILSFYLGILQQFLKRPWPSSFVSCPESGQVLSSIICLLCPFKNSCLVNPIQDLQVDDYLTVSSFSEIMLKVKEELGLI